MKINAILFIVALVGTIPVAMAQSGTSAGTSLTYTQPLSKTAVRSVQKRLHDIGLYEGNVDGDWGADTHKALMQFQQGRGLQASGQILRVPHIFEPQHRHKPAVLQADAKVVFGVLPNINEIFVVAPSRVGSVKVENGFRVL